MKLPRIKFFQLIIQFFIIVFSSTIVIGVYAQQTNQSITGDCNGQINGDSNQINITCFPLKLRRVAVVSNNTTGATLVIKEIKDVENPYAGIAKPDNQVGLIESGAKVKILGQTNPTNPIHSFTQIEVLEGRLKGKVGWVATSTIQIDEVSE
jgi:hypothetical protein